MFPPVHHSVQLVDYHCVILVLTLTGDNKRIKTLQNIVNQLPQTYHSETLCLVCQDSDPTYFTERHQYYHLEVRQSPLFSEKICNIFQEYYYLGKSPSKMFFVTIILALLSIPVLAQNTHVS